MNEISKKMPGRVRDSIIKVLEEASGPLTVNEIQRRVDAEIGTTSASSIRSYLRLNSPGLFVRESRGVYRVGDATSNVRQRYFTTLEENEPSYVFQKSVLHHDDCFTWLGKQSANTIHAVVTDPPYGLYEYTVEQQAKLRVGRGGVWRIPPSFDGNIRSPLPRFTTLDESQIAQIFDFFFVWAGLLKPVLTPGANVVVASHPLLSHVASGALAKAGLERRGEIIRLTMTMRGGDRPKGAHRQFSEVSVLPRSMWEPWLLFRNPLEGTVRENLTRWSTGGFRRPSEEKPFGDVIPSSPTRSAERKLAPHPSLKPQGFCGS